MENRGFSFRSILKNSLWITLTGYLLFSLSTMKRHNSLWITVTGTLLMTLPWIIQLLVTYAVILLHKTFGYNLMWIVHSPKPQENHHPRIVATTSPSSSPPLSSRQVVKKDNVDEFKITIEVGADGQTSPKDGFSPPLGMIMKIEGRNNTKLLTNGSPVAA